MSGIPSPQFWSRQRVFLTGHTGFKGGWMALWLRRLGAEVCGYALSPATKPSLYQAVGLRERIQSVIGDVRDLESMRRAAEDFRPTVILHLAAQPLVRRSYEAPVETYTTNVIGTVHALELARSMPEVTATLIVTTDKVYENREQVWPYREIDRLGGRDPYSNSKACAELAVASYWWSYFSRPKVRGLASARAGNVIGGGDWSADRLVPDLIKAFETGRPAVLRRPESVRPWQHVLEPLRGYLLAAEAIAAGGASDGPPTWNFGPNACDNVQVGRVAERLAAAWGDGAQVVIRAEANAPHEARLLTLDAAKAHADLGWSPCWDLIRAIAATAEWHRAFARGEDMAAVSARQIDDYTHEAALAALGE